MTAIKNHFSQIVFTNDWAFVYSIVAGNLLPLALIIRLMFLFPFFSSSSKTLMTISKLMNCGIKRMAKTYGWCIVVVFVPPSNYHRQRLAPSREKCWSSSNTTVNSWLSTKTTSKRPTHQNWIWLRIFVTWNIWMKRPCFMCCAKDMPTIWYTHELDRFWWSLTRWHHFRCIPKR